MAKGGQNQTVRQQLDPASQRFIEQFLRPLATQLTGLSLGQPLGGSFAGAQTALPAAGGGGITGGFGGILARGQAGLRGMPGATGAPAAPGGDAFTFDPSLIPQFFPGATPEFLQGVDILRNLDVSAMTDFDRQRALSRQRAAQLATAGGAFGGSRSAVLESIGQRDINEVEAQTLARLRGAQAQGLLGAGEQLRQIAQLQAQNPLFAAQQALGIAQTGLGIPGSITSQPLSGSPFGSALGGAAAGSAFGPIGAGIGGGLGLLGLL